jgi:transglutaminase-like putative cysteine protease
MRTVPRDSLEKYRQLSQKIATAQILAELRGLFETEYSLPELLDWVHVKVKWAKGNIKRHNDPKEILTYGKGRCGEFSILFAALCLAHNYRARLVLDMSDHVWIEIWNKKEKRWIHVDPSEKRIDDPKMYERDWKKNLMEVYAFENGKMENVTQRYKLKT